MSGPSGPAQAREVPSPPHSEREAGASEPDPAVAEAARVVSYLVLALAAIALYFAAGALPASRWEPLGAGTFPQLVFGAIIALCLVGLVQSGRSVRGTGAFTRLGGAIGGYLRARRLVIVLFAGLALYLALLRPLGFGPATFLFLLGACLLLAPRTGLAWGISLLIALAFSFGLDALFSEVFNVFLPRARWMPLW